MAAAPVIIGIDPGVTGAMAILKPKGLQPAVYDLPVTERTYLSNQSKRLDIIDFYNIIGDCLQDTCRYDLDYGAGIVLVTEQMQSLGRLTPPKTLTMLAEMAGNIDAAVRIWCLEQSFPLFIRKIQPKTWIHWMFPDSENRTGRKTEAKNESLETARRLFPMFKDEYLSRKKDHDRAEALLLTFVGAAELSGCKIDPTLKTFGDLAELYNQFSQNAEETRAKFSDIHNNRKDGCDRWSDEIAEEIRLRRPKN
jgi:hypothetical protein